jgi:hypothetical protein
VISRAVVVGLAGELAERASVHQRRNPGIRIVRWNSFSTQRRTESLSLHIVV